MATVDTLLVRIEADMSQLKKQLNSTQVAVQRSVGKQQLSFTRLGRTIKTVVAGVVAFQAIRFAKQMIDMTSAVEEMQSKSSVVFGRFVTDVRNELAQFGNEVGRSTFELEGMASSIQDTFVPMGFARGEAAKLSVQLTKLAVDVASFNNASDADTMRAFQSALVGNHETVRRFGVVITEATLKQELLRMGITKTADEVSNAEKVQARMNLIIAGTSDAHDDATFTADSFANKQKQLNAVLEELTVKVLTPLLPKLVSFVDLLLGGVDAVDEFVDAVSKTGKLLSYAETLDKIKQAETELKEEQAKADQVRSKGLGNLFKNIKDGIKAEGDLRLAIGGPKLFEDNIKNIKDRIAVLKQQAGALLENSSMEQLDEKTRKRNNELEQEKIELEKKRLANIMKPISRQEGLGLKEEELKQFYALDKATKDLANANELLTMKINGKTDAEIKARSIQLENSELSSEMFENINQQIILEGQLNKELEQKNKLDAMDIARKERIQELTKSLLTPTQELALLQNDLNNAYISGQIGQEQYALGTENLKLKLMEASESGKMALDTINKVADGFSKEFADALMSGELSLKSLKNVVADVMASIIRDFIRAQIRALIFKSILGFTGGGTAPSTGPTTFDATTGGFAGGGTVQAKTPIMVGERGAEMFIPNTGGVVRNAQDTRSMSTGKPVIVNQNINISTGVAQTVRAEVMNLMPQISQSTISAIVDAKQRGGSFATIMS